MFFSVPHFLVIGKNSSLLKKSAVSIRRYFYHEDSGTPVVGANLLYW